MFSILGLQKNILLIVKRFPIKILNNNQKQKFLHLKA